MKSDYTTLGMSHTVFKILSGENDSTSFITGVGLGGSHTKVNIYDPRMFVSIVAAQLPSPNIFL